MLVKITQPPQRGRVHAMRIMLTILKCTGGPPKEVKPRYQLCRTVFHSLSFRRSRPSQGRGRLSPIVPRRRPIGREGKEREKKKKKKG